MQAQPKPLPLKLEAGRSNPFEKHGLRSWTLLSGRRGYWPQDYDRARSQAADDYPSSVTPIDDGVVISFENLARFEISFAQKTITAFDIAGEPEEATLSHLLMDQVAPRILAHEGALVLHASAVAIDGQAAIFLGETGAGKSTLAASFDQAGHRLLGDDAVIISQTDDRFVAEPVYPSLRLFPDSVSALLGEEADVSAMAHYSDKQRVSVDKVPTSLALPLPIAGVFLLSGDPGAETIAAQRPSASQACIAVLEQSFSLDPKDGARAANRLAMASQLIEGVATFVLDYPNGYDRLADVHAVIKACVRGDERAQKGAI